MASFRSRAQSQAAAGRCGQPRNGRRRRDRASLEELVGELEGDLLRTRRGFAGQLVERIGKIAAGEIEQRQEGGWQRAAVVEEVVDGMADVELVDGEGSRRQLRRRGR